MSSCCSQCRARKFTLRPAGVADRNRCGLRKLRLVEAADQRCRDVAALFEPTLYGRALRRLAVAVFDDLRQGMQEIEFLAPAHQSALTPWIDQAMGTFATLAA